MARLARSKDVEANLRVGVSGILQFSERFQQVKIRQPATLVGWKAGERFLLDAGTPTYQNSERLHDFLHERCIFRFIENHCAYAIEARLLDVSVQMGRRALWIGWPKCIHLYPYRAQMRSEVDVPCNIQVILMSGAGDVQHGQILDISSSGCCFSVPKPFSSSIKVGRTVLLSFQLEDSERPSAVEGLVRHSRDYESSHLYGLEFGAIPEELTEAIKLVLSQKPHFSNELEALRQRDL